MHQTIDRRLPVATSKINLHWQRLNCTRRIKEKPSSNVLSTLRKQQQWISSEDVKKRLESGVKCLEAKTGYPYWPAVSKIDLRPPFPRTKEPGTGLKRTSVRYRRSANQLPDRNFRSTDSKVQIL
ncbi:hypothetical protein ACMFMG_005901 [Clarireedia jacksonii]